MKASEEQSKNRVGLLAAGLAVGLVVIYLAFFRSGGPSAEDLVFYTVKRGDLPINVTVRGNLESQTEEKVRCMIDDIEGDGIYGTPLLWIVPNGELVKKGDLIVEFDCSNHTERLDRQVLSTEKARASQIQAKVQYENQKTQNETNVAEGRLKVTLAELDLKQFEDEDGGTFQIDLDQVKLSIQEAQAGKLIEKTNLDGVEQLYRLGYRSSGELAQAKLSALKAERQLATAIAKKKELTEYQYQKNKLTLEGAVASAKRALEQVERDNEAMLEQAKAEMDAADQSLRKEEERLARYKQQIVNGKIYAPVSGMVAYSTLRSRYSREEIRPGAQVRLRQTILTIPNLKRMKVATNVHESVLDQVKKGLKATIKVDPFPDSQFLGSVQSVAVLPDQEWSSSDTKRYETVVTIDQDVDLLKPGMSAAVKIHVDHLESVLSVPIQALN
ncbi:MAG: efflux RND transporter periplasmic adaptor subunit, partial [Planctomycetota bacterium]